jgi:hypothetical protein
VAVLAAATLLAGATGASAAGAPAFKWAVAGGGGSTDDADGVGVDARGRPIISGGLTGPGGADIFVTGYTRGGHVRWSKRFGGPGADQAFDNDVDSRGDAVITGSFNQTVDFGGPVLTSRGGSLPRYGDAFVLKVASDGRTKWVRQVGGTGSDGGDEIVVGPRNDVYAIGDSETAGNRDAWVNRYRKGGRLVWSTPLGGSGQQQSHGIATDRKGNALVTGEFVGRAQFGAHVLDSAPGPDVFLARLDRHGRVRWAQRYGAAGNQLGRGVDADDRGHVYFSGQYAGTMQVGSTTLTSTGGEDMFLAKATPRGRVLWAMSFGGPGADAGPELEVDARGNSYLTGLFSGTARFGSRTLTADGARAAFVMKVSPQGRVRWVVGSKASPFATLGELSLGGGWVTVLGRFVSEVTLGRFELDGLGETDYFLARLPR